MFSCFYSFLGFEVPISGNKDMVLLLSSGWGTFHVRGLFLAFRRTKDGLSVLVPGISQVASIQNNQHAIVAHFGPPALAPLPWAPTEVKVIKTDSKYS